MCYGAELHPDFKDKIAAFKKDFINLGISIAPKVHVVMFHIAEFCKITGQGLGPWSEQSGESVHHDFKGTWNRFIVNDTNRDIYGENLEKSSLCL